MSELEAYLAEHYFDAVQAGLWARFLEAVLNAMQEAATAVRDSEFWAAHIIKKGALLKPRRAAAEAGRRLPAEEGITVALAEKLDRHRMSVPAGHVLRSEEVEFKSEARMPSKKKTGKHARRIDVMARSMTRVDAPLIVFEAKLVVSRTDLQKGYFGPEGLGCFTLPPDPYPAKDLAGMVAYVVDHESEHWSAEVEVEMARLQPAPLSQRRLRHSAGSPSLLWSRIERPQLVDARPLSVANLVLRFEAVPVASRTSGKAGSSGSSGSNPKRHVPDDLAGQEAQAEPQAKVPRGGRKSRPRATPLNID